MSNECGIAKQITDKANEPESAECSICFSSMTEFEDGCLPMGKCDNKECESNDE